MQIRTCKTCDNQFPETAEHFYATRSRRASGHVFVGFRGSCIFCVLNSRKARYYGPQRLEIKELLRKQSAERRKCSEIRAREAEVARERKRKLMDALESRAMLAQKVRDFRAANPEKYQKYKAYRGTNATRRFHVAMRRAKKMMATPPWIAREEIKKFYVEAQARTRETGILYVVDHIMPLQGRNFCGLNVPWNLQVITQSENSKKGNRVLF